ncbi:MULTISPECIES: energy-coupling factor transporter transmembrane component T [unclassified Paludibacterium]|uniref:energy-coupling factor transporter transmembrane component T n=1 Tax=unclassified Paludibacterium TaxID=2618429 RepID=UPI001C03C39A|nr:energy-coupling factor transporter transmembrane component T [Paludibacterium sp. B53371]BEV72143.1 energy-coupling factor transporter transmembrane component T [Paludibacterium sp. THUN1379]
MHPFTGLAWVLPLALLVLQLEQPGHGLGLLVLLVVLLGLRPDGSARLRRWALVMVPLALGLLLVHGRWLSVWLGADLRQADVALKPVMMLWLRVGTVLAAALLWLSTLTPERLIRALFASRLPPGAAYLLANPMLLVSQIKTRLAAIAQAQAARGVDVQASRFRRWRHLLALTFPLLVWTLSDVTARAAALDGRAFRSRPRRTTLDAPSMAFWERGVIALGLSLSALLTGVALWH